MRKKLHTSCRLPEVCGRHTDALIYWDRLAFRPPIVSSRFFIWKTDPILSGQLQNDLHSIPWNGVSCVRCAAAASPTFPDSVFMKGPYYIRPQPQPIDGVPTLQFISLNVQHSADQRAFHLTIRSPSGIRHGTFVADTVMGLTGTPLLFDRAAPGHHCRTSSWCRVTWQTSNAFRLCTP